MNHDINLEFVFDRPLRFADIDDLQARLFALAPSWSRELRVWRSNKEQIPAPESDPQALSRFVFADARERCLRFGVDVNGELNRVLGSFELRGADDDLTAVLVIDSMSVSPMGQALRLGNSIALHIRGAAIDQLAGTDWARDAMAAFCQMDPVWGSATSPDEYSAKVMYNEGGHVRADGRDFGRALPGLFWLNFFGQRYVDFVGEEWIASTPSASRLATGYMIARGDSPDAWDSPETRQLEKQILDHLGHDLFYSKEHPDRGRVPDWV